MLALPEKNYVLLFKTLFGIILMVTFSKKIREIRYSMLILIFCFFNFCGKTV